MFLYVNHTYVYMYIFVFEYLCGMTTSFWFFGAVGVVVLRLP